MQRVRMMTILFCGSVGLINFAYVDAAPAKPVAVVPRIQTCPMASQITYDPQNGTYYGPGGWYFHDDTGTNKVAYFYAMQLNEGVPGECCYALNPLTLGYICPQQSGRHAYQPMGPNWRNGSDPTNNFCGNMPSHNPNDCLYTDQMNGKKN